MIILSLDPSLTAFGWAVIEKTPTKETIKDCGCIETKKLPGSVTESDTERVHKIVSELTDVLTRHQPVQISSESPAGSKSSTAIKALSLVKGAIIGLSAVWGIPYQFISARNAKLATTKNPVAEKDEVLREVENRFPEFKNLTNKWSKSKKYAAADAISVYIATL